MIGSPAKIYCCNARGRVDVNPLEYAVGHGKKLTFIELLKHHADPNQRDAEGDNAVTLSAQKFKQDPDFLILAIKSGGDPNTRGPDGDPILVDFTAAHNIDAIKTLFNLGADINVRTRTRRPVIIGAALSENWDVVWCLLSLGAKFDYSGEPTSIADCFRNPRATPPDSPLYADKMKSRKFLIEHGVALPAIE